MILTCVLCCMIQAWEVFRWMKDKGMRPNSYTYGALLKGYSEQGCSGPLDADRLTEYTKAFEAAVKVRHQSDQKGRGGKRGKV